jgi:hypothetical protein
MNQYKRIKENLELFAEKDDIKLHTANMFIHLIDMLGEETFNLNFTQNADYHENFDNFYFGYHKQFRQCDMFDMEAAEFIGFKTYEENKEKWDKRAEDKDGHIVRNYLMYSIGGHLDMLFWNMIHIDSELWESSLEATYKEYKESITEKV